MVKLTRFYWFANRSVGEGLPGVAQKTAASPKRPNRVTTHKSCNPGALCTTCRQLTDPRALLSAAGLLSVSSISCSFWKAGERLSRLLQVSTFPECGTFVYLRGLLRAPTLEGKFGFQGICYPTLDLSCFSCTHSATSLFV